MKHLKQLVIGTHVMPAMNGQQAASRRKAAGFRLLVSLFAMTLLTGLTAYSQTVNVTMRITADNAYRIFVGDATSVHTIVGEDGDFTLTGWKSIETHTFTVSFGDYIYVFATDELPPPPDPDNPSMLLAETVLSLGANTWTIHTGVSNPFTNWEVADEIRPSTDPFLADIPTLNGWISSTPGWGAPAVGNPAQNGNIGGPFDHTSLLPARYIWAQPGGGSAVWGFAGDTGNNAVLFRLQVVPEPTSMVALASGIVGLIRLCRRRTPRT